MMRKLFRQQSIPYEGYPCMFTSRPGSKPGLWDRLLGWFIKLEPENEAQYAEYKEYEAEQEINRASMSEYGRTNEYGMEYNGGNQVHRDYDEQSFRPRPVLALSAGRLRRVQQALNDWKAATAYFESVSDPELVDYAVYEMEAAQKRYIYLLRSAKSVQDGFMRRM